MKVIMETISGRKGCKDFARIEDFGDFMVKYEDKVKRFRILEDNEQLPNQTKPVDKPTDKITDKTVSEPAVNDANTKIIDAKLKDLIDKCTDLSREILCVYFGEAKSSDDYKSLLKASQKVANTVPLLKACVKNNEAIK